MNIGTYIRIGTVFALGATAMVAFGACGGDDDESDSSGAGPTVTLAVGGGSGGATTPVASTGGGETTAGDGIVIAMKDNLFEPKTIKVPKNKSIEITVKNTGTAIHNMHVLSKKAEGKDFASATIVNPGDTSKFTVKFTKSGTVKFVCDYHLPDMAGEIKVQ